MTIVKVVTAGSLKKINLSPDVFLSLSFGVILLLIGSSSCFPHFESVRKKITLDIVTDLL